MNISSKNQPYSHPELCDVNCKCSHLSFAPPSLPVPPCSSSSPSSSPLLPTNPCQASRESIPAALLTARNHIDQVVEQDIQRVDGTEKNPERVKLALHSLTRNISTIAIIQTIKADIEANDASITDKILLNQ